MISKCQNIVINRTKFSDFELLDQSQAINNDVKLVGYFETTDYCTGETIKKNVAVDYPQFEATSVETKVSYNFIPTLGISDTAGAIVTQYIDGPSYIIQQGAADYIQIHGYSSDVWSSNGTLAIGFNKNISIGRKFQLLFANFPTSEHDLELVSIIDGVKQTSSIILPRGTYASNNILLTFVQKSGSTIDSAKRETILTEIQFV